MRNAGAAERHAGRSGGVALRRGPARGEPGAGGAGAEQVPEPFRTTLILRDIEGFVYEEVAEMQGVNLGTVKSRLVRGRACLKALLTAPQPGSHPTALAGIEIVPGRGGAMNGCNEVQAGLLNIWMAG